MVLRVSRCRQVNDVARQSVSEGEDIHGMQLLVIPPVSGENAAFRIGNVDRRLAGADVIEKRYSDLFSIQAMVLCWLLPCQ